MSIVSLPVNPFFYNYIISFKIFYLHFLSFYNSITISLPLQNIFYHFLIQMFLGTIISLSCSSKYIVAVTLNPGTIYGITSSGFTSVSNIFSEVVSDTSEILDIFVTFPGKLFFFSKCLRFRSIFVLYTHFLHHTLVLLKLFLYLINPLSP